MHFDGAPNRPRQVSIRRLSPDRTSLLSRGRRIGQPTFIFRFQRMTSPSHLTTPWLGLEMCISVARTVMEGNDSQILLNFLLSALIILECPRTYISEKETSRLDKISPAEGNAC